MAAKDWAVSHIVTKSHPHKTVWFSSKKECEDYLEEQRLGFLSFWKGNKYGHLSFAPIAEGLAMIGRDGIQEARLIIVNTNTDDKSLFCKGLGGGVQTMTTGTSIGEETPDV